jgi:predicted solute-binding protein
MVLTSDPVPLSNTYAAAGFKKLLDLGEWWKTETGLPLPLGGNVIHKRFDPATRKIISDTLTASIQFSLDHRPEAVQHALQAPAQSFLDINWRVRNCSVTEFVFDRRRLTLDNFNGIPHLEDAALRTYR